MRIYIDIGHPAHVHYFKNFIKIMEDKGHVFFVSARNRSVIFSLLKKYNISYYDRGKGRDGVFGKLFYLIYADFKLISQAFRFKPQICISFASPYAAHTAWLLRIPHIAIDDTEHAKFGHILYKPFSKVFLNPVCFQKDFGKKQILFNSYAELFFLHDNYFKPSKVVLNQLGLSEDDKFALLRFISWNANHDIGHSGLDLETKKKLIKKLTNLGYKVFISSEAENKDPFFDKYLIKTSPELIHQVMSQADLVVSEGATMAAESAMLGIPAIYVNSLDAGTLRELEDKYQLIHGFRSSEGVIEKVLEIINSTDYKKQYQMRRDKMLSEKIDVTAFLVWFIENYPSSVKVMRENPDYQYNFK